MMKRQSCHQTGLQGHLSQPGPPPSEPSPEACLLGPGGRTPGVPLHVGEKGNTAPWPPVLQHQEGPGREREAEDLGGLLGVVSVAIEGLRGLACTYPQKRL